VKCAGCRARVRDLKWGQCMECGTWFPGHEEGTKCRLDCDVEWWRNHLALWLVLPRADVDAAEALRERSEVRAIREILALTRRRG